MHAKSLKNVPNEKSVSALDSLYFPGTQIQVYTIFPPAFRCCTRVHSLFLPFKKSDLVFYERRKGSLKRRHNCNKTLAAISISSFTASLDDRTPFYIFFYLIFINSSGLVFKSKFYRRHNVANTRKIKEPRDILSCFVCHLLRHWLVHY